MNRQQKIRIGTRGSPLALVQARAVRDLLLAAHEALTVGDIDIQVIKTSGDKIRDRPLSEVGGKGLFTKEIEEALLQNDIDLAVHSMKDMPSELPEGLVIPCLLARGDPRDAFMSPHAVDLAALPQGAVLGTSSLRRAAQVLACRPDLKIVQFRGNVDTRLAKLQAGVADATLLACAGLKRLGMADRITSVMSPDDMLPAVAQGVIGVECRAKDAETLALLAPIHDADTATCVAAERAFLAVLDGSCRTPIAGFAELEGDNLRLRGEILSPDGQHRHKVELRGPRHDATALGVKAGADVLRKAGPDFLARHAPEPPRDAG